jgi:hypothetical protein
MSTSPVEICNSALVKVGAARITSLNDPTKTARICKEQYDKLRRKLLRDHPWNFSISRVALGLTTNVPAFEFTKEFLLPSDVLRVIETDLHETTSWEQEINKNNKKVIVTDASSLKIKYIKDVTDTSIFASDFSEVLAYLIASDLAYSIVQSVNLQRQTFQIYKDQLAQARSFDSQESGSRKQIEANEWISARFS